MTSQRPAAVIPSEDEELYAAAEACIRDHPEIGEALEVFGLSIAEYQAALSALRPAHLVTSSNSTPSSWSR